jgi:hypothetical protein
MKINDMILLPVNLWKGFASAVSVEYFLKTQKGSKPKAYAVISLINGSH